MDRNSRNSLKTTRKYKKKFLWTARNEKILLKLWKERVHELKNSRQNKSIFEDIRQNLQQKGCFVEIDEIRHKVHNLSSKYRKERFNRASGCSPSEWPLYDVLDDMLSSFESNNVVDLVGELSRCLDDNSPPPHQSNSEKSEDKDHYEYVNEDFFDNENEDEEEKASTSMSECKNASKSNKDTIYLKTINTNLELMVEKVNELSENIQSWEEKGISQLEQITNILRKRKTSANEYNNAPMHAKRIKLSQNDDAVEDISNFYEEIPEDQEGEDETDIPTMKSYTLQRNKIIINDYLKTKQLEREFMTEKHNLQMEILKLELDAKRNVLRE